MSCPEKKKLGFTDKIKKMLESDSLKEKNTNSEDRSLKFNLIGGNVHSELLVAEAIMDSKKG